MSKELEAFKIVYNNIDYITSDLIFDGEASECLECVEKQLPIIKQALQRLEAIDNAEPSEALEKLGDISYLVLNEIDDLKNKELWKSYFGTIKQALIQKTKKEQAWDIVVKKNVDVGLIKKLGSAGQYNSHKWDWMPNLTEEEFNTLKESVGE